MGLGAGIVVATCVLILVWQIDKRHAWRRLGRWTAVLLALVVIVIVGAVGYARYQDHRVDLERQAAAKSIQEGKLSELAGVSLGATREEVQYRWGMPTAENDDVLQWSDANSDKAVAFNRQGGVRVVLCAANGDYLSLADCGDVAGLSTGSSEEAVLARLGPPSTPPSYEKTEKTLRYGTAQDGLDIVLNAKGVVRFVVYRGRTQVARVPGAPPTVASAFPPARLAPVPESPTPTEPSTVPPSAPEKPLPPVQVPEDFLGEWNAQLADCGTSNNDSRLRIEAKSIHFYESSGPIVIAADRGPRRVMLVSRLQGEGTVFFRGTDFSLSEDGATLTDNASGYARHRCPANESSASPN